MVERKLGLGALCVAMCAGAGWGCTQYKLSEPETPPVHPQSGPPSGLAQVCIVRPQRFGGGLTHLYRDNGNLVGATRGRGYFCYYADPGTHQVQASHVDAWIHATDLEVELEAEQRTFIHHHFRWGQSSLVLVGADEADELIDDADYQVLTRGPDVERLPNAFQVAPSDPDERIRTMQCEPEADGSMVCLDPHVAPALAEAATQESSRSEPSDGPPL